MLTPRPWPRWSAETFASSPYFSERVAFVFRSTWKVAHSRPIFSSRGLKARGQRLPRSSGDARFSEGNTNASGDVERAIPRQVRKSSREPLDTADSRGLPLLGVSK